MTYFNFYNIPVAFILDEKALKRQFYKLSKQYHPDFYTLESEEKQAEILQLSTLNNEAYKTLSNFDARMKYVLDILGIMDEEGKNKIPQDFLMDMMDINEVLMELQFDFDKKAFNEVKKSVQGKEAELYTSIEETLSNYNPETTTKKDLEKVKNFYLKRRYLLRINKNLSTFATY